MGRYVAGSVDKSMGPTPGVEAPLTSDGPDVFGAGYGVEGVVIDGRCQVRRVCRVGWWFEEASVDEQVENSKIGNSLILFVN
jgi:hypothetical protein